MTNENSQNLPHASGSLLPRLPIRPIISTVNPKKQADFTVTHIVSVGVTFLSRSHRRTRHIDVK
jgi:hypothetical protein